MAVSTVKVAIKGQTYDLTYNSTSKNGKEQLLHPVRQVLITMQGIIIR